MVGNCLWLTKGYIHRGQRVIVPHLPVQRRRRPLSGFCSSIQIVSDQKPYIIITVIVPAAAGCLLAGMQEFIHR